MGWDFFPRASLQFLRQTAPAERLTLATNLQPFELPRDRAADRVSVKKIQKGDMAMLSWALTFFVIALIAALLGFGGVAFAAADIAKICFFIFLVLFVVSLVAHGVRRV